jgi:hypothetical protein
MRQDRVSRTNQGEFARISHGSIFQFVLPVALPFLIFLLHASLFRSWIVDDAGISFAYARNLALGNGLVSQPGAPPVEGFSNLTWVLLLTPFFVAHAFDPLVTPKIISLVLVLASFILIQSVLVSTSKHRVVGTFLVLGLLALNPSFVIWTTSGLEGPLYVLVVVLMLRQLTGGDAGTFRGAPLAGLLAVLAALCALTRPDGILYGAAFPVAVCIAFAFRKLSLSDSLRSIVIYAGGFAICFGSYLLFRYMYFGDLLPNTFYAKGGGLNLSPVDWYNNAGNLFKSSGPNKYLLAALVAVFLYVGGPRSITRRHFGVVVVLVISILIYALLPLDGMGEFRFAAPFFPAYYLLIFLITEIVYESASSRMAIRAVLVSVAIVAAGSGIGSFFARSTSFAAAPTVPFAMVADLFGVRFNQYAAELGVKDGSLLVPDLGGTLYYSDLRVYDLAGLTDKVIARTLGRDQQAFYDYVFASIKPTFIHTHGAWAYRAALDADPRFRRDYVAIDEATDDWILTRLGQHISSGDFVRKDAIHNYDALARIRAGSFAKCSELYLCSSGGAGSQTP